jgi:hypothetical protein
MFTGWGPVGAGSHLGSGTGLDQSLLNGELVAQALVRTISAEEVEYAHLLQEIEARKRRVVDLQADLETLKRALARFELEYRARVGPFLVEVERLRLELAEYRRRIAWLRAGVNPDLADEEHDLAAEFAARREEVRAEAEATRRYQRAYRQEQTKPPVDANSDAELRRLYRELAKRFHPDLSASPEERAQRQEIMLRINAAFRDRDLAALRSLERETERHDPAFAERTAAEKLAWAEREANRLDSAIQDLEAQITVLRQSDTYQYWHAPDAIVSAIERLTDSARAKQARLQERLAERKVVYRRLARRNR